MISYTAIIASSNVVTKHSIKSVGMSDINPIVSIKITCKLHGSRPKKTMLIQICKISSFNET